MRLQISGVARQQRKIVQRRNVARDYRVHKASHMAMAAELNAQADYIQSEIDAHPEMPDTAREEGFAMITRLRSDAIANENAKCLDDRDH
ncbi:hypothetical protein SEA_CRUNCHYBOI_21 [Microbacterium phage CrunchyBoi]|nr:hypothetical protein SEA_PINEAPPLEPLUTO_21 [Microbacterium phage PineapplePluto]QQO39364.1 hypothetical protein SEA_CRUNCHYBOI_21 [Microbacterium phage CrunchyBoi]